jgi:hypothetical protein
MNSKMMENYNTMLAILDRSNTEEIDQDGMEAQRNSVFQERSSFQS